VAAGNLSAEYVAQLITAGAFGRDLTPRELFALPFSNPGWPLVATVDDLRRVMFEMATSPEWMLTDSDGSEVRPGSPHQIQPNSMQQQLRARRETAAPAATPDQPVRDFPSPEPADTFNATPMTPSPPVVEPAVPTEPNSTREHTAYEVTRIKLSLASVTDHVKREAIWGLLREVASAADPARRA